MISNNKIHYRAIDVAKLFFSICVVILHSGMNTVLPHYFIFEKGIFRLAVPFFFVTSGFFLGQKFKKDNINHVTVTYVKRLLIPFVVYGIINTCLEILLMIQRGEENIIITVTKHIAFYPYGAFWYIYASIVGAILLSFFVKHKKLNIGLIIGFVLYLFALLCNNYYFIAKSFEINSIIDLYMNLFISARNGLFVGFFMLGIGVKLSSITIKVKKLHLFVLTVCLYCLYLFEIFLLKGKASIDDGALYLMLIVFIPTLVLFLMSVSPNLSDKSAKLCRNFSTGIYFQHRMWLNLVAIFSIAHNPFVCLCIALCASITVCIISHQSKNKILIKLTS